MREVNVGVLDKRVGTAACKWCEFKINQLLFGNVTALMAYSEKLCILVSEFRRVCEKRCE